jgi:hypothetical protein
MLKCSVSSALAVLVCTAPVAAQTATAGPQTPAPGGPAISTSVSTDFSYSSWEGTRGSNTFAPERGKGSQLYTPVSGSLVTEWADRLKWESAIKGGFVHSRHATIGQQATFNGAVDTQVTNTVTWLSSAMIRPFISLSLNLPTGDAYLPGRQRFARMDQDLVDLGSYGEGFNYNPVAGFTIALSPNIVVTPSVGYAVTGKYVREGINFTTGLYDTHKAIDPGDVFTATLNSTLKQGALTVELATTFATETATQTNGVASRQRGNSYTSNATVQYEASTDLSLQLVGSWSFVERDKVPAVAALAKEPRNSNSNVLVGTFQPTYKLDARTRVFVLYSILYRDQNFYDIFAEQFVPSKTKQSVGAGMSYALTDKIDFNLKGSHFWSHESDGAKLITQSEVVEIPPSVTDTFGASAPPALAYTGWNVTATIGAKF